MKSIKDIPWDELTNGREFHPSPTAWEDEVLYFLLVDRFSNGREHETPMAVSADFGNAVTSEDKAAEWREAGGRWCGGTLEGVHSKLGYLKGLGITTIWLSPVFKQCAFQESYHGYGIQNFLEIDPHFGTAQDLRRLVDAAHAEGIRVLLDIIINHTGDVFAYRGETRQDGVVEEHWPYWNGQTFPVLAFRDASGNPTLPVNDAGLLQKAWPDGAIWPCELQQEETFTRRGQIRNWDNEPEYLDGDFYTLKDVDVGKGGLDGYVPSHAMKVITTCFKYWIAFSDIDGYRLDTVKHLDPGATRWFSTEIHEFAKTLGKHNFFLLGEITGGMEFAVGMIEKTGLDAALGINRIPDKLENAVKGWCNPSDYFRIFRNSELLGEGEDRWYRDRVVSMFDDHDMVIMNLDAKGRFACAEGMAPLLPAALFLNAGTLGIPCIYYGTEQGFDGHGNNDRFIRECMFGGPFGAFRTKGVHFFNEEHPVYKVTSAMLDMRRRLLAMRQGRQYLREQSAVDAEDSEPCWYLPERIGDGRMTDVFAWSRILSGEELVLAINADLELPHTVRVIIDPDMHVEGERFACQFLLGGVASTADSSVVAASGRKCIRITVPPASCGMWRNEFRQP